MMHYQDDQYISKHLAIVNKKIYHDLKFYGVICKKSPLTKICEWCYVNDQSVTTNHLCLVCLGIGHYESEDECLHCEDKSHTKNQRYCFPCQEKTCKGYAYVESL